MEDEEQNSDATVGIESDSEDCFEINVYELHSDYLNQVEFIS